MPRRYYTRYRPRPYGKRRKWSPTLLQGVSTLSIPASSSQALTGFTSTVLCGNSANSGTTTPVSTIIKVKNFKVVCDITVTQNTIRNLFFAIMFLPQGFTPTVTTPQEHPEWVMVWRTVDATSAGEQRAQGIPNIQLSSRLTRNLNSGDSIVLYQSGTLPANVTSINVNTAYYCSFVTCNN